MAQITDKDGTWEVTEGNGCINKCLIEPSAEYLANNPVVVEPDADEELAKNIAAATTIAGIKDALLGKYGIARVKGQKK